MKVNMSDATARKTLAAIPADTTDQDLVQLRDRLEQGLKASTAGGIMNVPELAAVLTLVQSELRQPAHFHVVGEINDQLRTAMPKIQALLDRAHAQAAG